MKKLIIFRFVAFLEGFSYIILLFVGVPIKYLNGDVTIVKTLGMPHGMLFIIYLALVIVLCFYHKWFKKHFILISLASVIPFGTFIVEYKLRKLK